MSDAATYPVRVEAELDPQLSRWLWLVKWFLAIPHFLALSFLWVAYVVMTVIAFFAILFTGRYPSSIFEFNVGVLRWTWRVSYYSFGANGTDRYPPFALAEVPDYPTHLDVAYPDRLSRGLVLVKWWLLAIPHYIVTGLFLGGGWVAWNAGADARMAGFGLIGILVLLAVVALLFTGRYPGGLFDLVLGLNRWVIRVAAYAGLMTDRYPPFRLDMGGHEPGGTLTIPPPPAPTGPAAPTAPEGLETATRRPGWTGGRITAVVLGSLLVLGSVPSFALGGFGLWADRTQRDPAGFISSPERTYSTGTYALVVSQIDLGGPATADIFPRGLLGDVRIRATSSDTGRPIFVGIAPTTRVQRYLVGVGRARITNVGDATVVTRPGTAPTAAPADQRFWTASTQGNGTRTLLWRPEAGTWSIVVMNADGSRGVEVTARAGAMLPDLGWVATALLVLGVLLLTGGALAIALAIRRAQGTRRAS